MFCSACGKTLAPQSRFCSECGASVQVPSEPKLLRLRTPRMIAGICSGVALQYGWDLALTRILLVVFTLLTSGAGILVYAAAWILIPETPLTDGAGLRYAQATQPPVPYSQNQGSV